MTKTVASRIGLGKTRHLAVKYLWLQEVVKAKRLIVQNIQGNVTPGGCAREASERGGGEPIVAQRRGFSCSEFARPQVRNRLGRPWRVTSRQLLHNISCWSRAAAGRIRPKGAGF